MNIAILIPTLTAGGAERAASEIGRHLKSEGNNVFYFLPSNSRRIFFDVDGEVVKTHITYPFSGSDPYTNIREMIFAARELKKIKKQHNVEVCISFMEGCNVLNVCSRTLKEKVVISVRTVLSQRREYDGIFVYRKRFINNIYRFSDSIVAVSDGIRQDLIENYGINPNKIIVIPNASNRYMTKDTDADIKKWAYGEKAIVCIGRFDPVKQFDSVIRAFSTIVNLVPDAKLIFVGDGRQMNHMKEIRKKIGLEDTVIFEGYQNNIGYYLENARCFVMSSKVEGFPNAMVEAMAYGVPVISTDTPGGCREILGRTHEISETTYCAYGLMTPQIQREEEEDAYITKEERILGEAILQMLKNEDLYAKYSQKSYIRSKYYSNENVMGMWNDLLSKLKRG